MARWKRDPQVSRESWAGELPVLPPPSLCLSLCTLSCCFSSASLTLQLAHLLKHTHTHTLTICYIILARTIFTPQKNNRQSLVSGIYSCVKVQPDSLLFFYFALLNSWKNKDNRKGSNYNSWIVHTAWLITHIKVWAVCVVKELWNERLKQDQLGKMLKLKKKNVSQLTPATLHYF